MHTRSGSFSLGHGSDVHGVLKHAVDGRVGPVGGLFVPMVVGVMLPTESLVFTGTGNFFCVEEFSNANFSKAGFKQIKDALNNWRSNGIDLQVVMILRGLLIAIGGKGPHKLSLGLFGPKGAADFLGDISGILLIKDVLEGEHQIVFPLRTVNVVV